MKHVQVLSRAGLGRAQVESLMLVVNLLGAVLGLYTQVAYTFGIPIPQKGTEEAQ